MLLRTDKLAECRDLTKPLVEDKTLAANRYRPQALYLNGYAHFLLKDYPSAGRSLAQLAPFADPVVGHHTRYLLARSHHLASEREEAAAHYQAVMESYKKAQKAASSSSKK